MRIKSLLGVLVGVVFIAILGFRFFSKPISISHQKPIIVISQIIDHNTLNTVYQGLLDGLKEHGYKDEENIQIFYENAHGNYTLSKQIADKFISMKPTIMVGLSTQSAQSFVKTSADKNIPLVFSAVTDPTAAKLIGPTITGVSDFMSAEPQIELFLKLLPNLKKLGILYNPSEINSVSFIEKFEIVAQAKGITIVRAALNTTAEATAVASSLVGKVDAMYFPNDNTAMAAVKSIVAVGLKHQLPVFANDSASVEQGAVAAVAYDRYQMGKTTADMIDKILKGQEVSSIPIVYNAPTQVVINRASSQTLKLSVPDDLKNVVWIE